MGLFTKELPKENVFRVRYEDLCKETRIVMSDVMLFLGLSYESAILSRNAKNAHNLGGGPSKCSDEKTEIIADEAYNSKFSDDELCKIKKIVAEEAVIWGYE